MLVEDSVLFVLPYQIDIWVLGKDEAARKATWVTLFGVEETKAKLRELEQDGLTLLDNDLFEKKAIKALAGMLQYAIHRTN